MGRTNRAWSRVLRPFQDRHAFKELGVSLGVVPSLTGISACRNLRCRDSALGRTLAESSARGRAEIVAPPADAIGICCSDEVNRGSVRRPSLCDSNVCGMSETRIVAAVSRAVTAESAVTGSRTTDTG